MGANLNKWTPSDFENAKQLITAYKEVRETVQHGMLYRLVAPRNGSEKSVTESVATNKQQGVLFTFLHSSQMGYPFPRVYLRGFRSESELSCVFNRCCADEGLAYRCKWKLLDVARR